MLGNDTTPVLPAGMFAVTYQWPASVACRVCCQPGIGPHTFWSTYGSVLAPVISAFGPNGQCPIWALVTQTVLVRAELELELWLGDVVAGSGVVVTAVGVVVTGVRVVDLVSGLGLGVRCGPGRCVPCCLGLGVAERAEREDAVLCSGEQPATAMAAVALTATRTVRDRDSQAIGGCLSGGLPERSRYGICVGNSGESPASPTAVDVPDLRWRVFRKPGPRRHGMTRHGRHDTP